MKKIINTNLLMKVAMAFGIISLITVEVMILSFVASKGYIKLSSLWVSYVVLGILLFLVLIFFFVYLQADDKAAECYTTVEGCRF